MFRKHVLAAIALVTCALAVPSIARAVLLSDLFAGQSLTVEDKAFTNWTLITNTGVNGGNADPTVINVTGLGGNPLNPGLRYTAPLEIAGAPGIGTPFGHAGPSSVNLDFSFRVSTLSGDPLIKDNSLLLTDWLFDSGVGASIQITETILNLLPLQIGQKLVFLAATDSGLAGDLDDNANFAPVSAIDVITRIFVNGPGTNDGVRLMGFEQRFSQVSGTVVPAPGSAALLMLGLLGLALQRRARRA